MKKPLPSIWQTYGKISMHAVWQKIWADLVHRRLVSLLILGTIAAAAALLTLALTTLFNLEAPYDKSHAELNGAHLWLHFKPGRVRSMDIRQIESLPQVTESTGRQFSYTTSVRFDAQRVLVSLRVISLEPPRVNRLRLLSGRFLLPEEDALLISRDLRDIYHLGPGDYLEITRADGHRVSLPIVGVVYDPMYDNYRSSLPPYVYLTQDLLASLFPDKSTWEWSLGLRLANPEEVQSVLKQIEAMRTVTFIASHTDWRDVRSSAIFDAQMAFIFLSAFSLFAILATVLIVVSIVSSTVLAQIKQIGILKAVGFTGQQVSGVYVGQYALLSLLGTLVGFLLGLWLSPLPLKTVTASLNTIYQPPFNPWTMLIVFCAVPGITVLSAAMASGRGVRVNTIQAIAVGGETLLKKAFWLARFLEKAGAPMPLVLGVNDVFVKPLRSLLAGINLTLGVMGVVFGLALSGTIQVYRQNPALLGMVYDAIVTREQSSDERARRLIGQAPGVEAFYGEYLLEAKTLDGRSLKLRAVEGDLEAFPFHILEGRFFLPDTSEALAGKGLLDWLGLNVGDSLTLILDKDDGPQATWVIVGEYPEPADAGQRLMVNLSSVRPLVKHTSPSVYYLKLAPSADAEAIRAFLSPRRESDLNFMLMEDVIPSTVIYLQIAVFMLAGILIGIAMVNILIMSLLSAQEKLRVVGILKTVGMTPWQVITMFVTTATFLGVLSTVAGVPAGLILTKNLLNLMASFTGFGQISVTWKNLAFWGLLPFTLFVSVLGSFLPARWAAKVYIVEVLRKE
jgi:putative ABC transport system permease protein